MAQKPIRDPYDVKMEQQAIRNFNTTIFKPIKSKERLLTLRPIKKIKITVKSGLNQDAAGSMIMNSITSGFDSFDGMTMEDYSSLGKYDIRCKYYLTKKIRLLNRLTGAGLNGNGLGYSSGIIIKF